MSSHDQEDRPKLKARRFNKFESTSKRPSTADSANRNSPQNRQRLKRPNNERLQEESQLPKRVCPGFVSPATCTKNLANSRLQKLRQNLKTAKSELKHDDTQNGSNKTSSMKSPLNIQNNNSQDSFAASNGHGFSQEDSSLASPPETSANIYRNLDKWASPPNATPTKNLANSRLQRLRSVVKDLKPSPTLSTTPEKSPAVNDTVTVHTSPLLRNKESGVKRNVSDSEPIIECTPSKRVMVSPLGSTCSPFVPQSPVSRETDVPVSPVRKKVDESSVNLSSRTLKMKQNLENINSSLNQNSPVFSRNSHERVVATSTPVSKRLNLNRNTVKANAFSPDPNFKLPSVPPKIQNAPPPEKTTLMVENRDNFNGKMAMTASWIQIHQNLNENQSEIECKPEVEAKIEETSDDTEEMEWTNAEPDTEKAPTIQDSESLKNEEATKEAEKLKDLCIVVDTNIFISALSKIKDIIQMKITGSNQFPGPIQPVLYIPWMVITELDFMKHDCRDDKVKQKVTNAIKFINSVLNEKNPRLLGQTIFDMDKQKSVGLSPDDKIISSCLQAAEKYESVILLSNDLNLKSKALINGLTASSANEIIMKIMSQLTKNTKSQKIMQKMSILCSSVICECAKTTFGNVWSKMDMLSCPPWSLIDCLKRFKRYWGTVFKDRLMKQFTKYVEDLLQLFDRNKYFSDDSEDFVHFMKLCINLCIFLKDMEEFRGSVENTLAEITKLG